MDTDTPRVRELALVRQVLGLDDHSNVEYEDDGWDSRVYLVNGGEAVFKFPRWPETKVQYKREVRVLDALQTIKSPILIPLVEWRGPDLQWFGYNGIVGQPLSSCLPDLEADTKRFIGRELGLFLRKLHAHRIDELPVVSVESEIALYQDKYRLAARALDQLTASERRVTQSFFCEALPRHLRELGGDLRVTHGDLGPWNIIFSPQSQVGVIDFGDAAYQDPSKDFSGFGDDTILRAAFAAYGADDWLREKAWLRIKAFPILDIPFYLGKDDLPGVQACLELVRRLIVRGEVSAVRTVHTADSDTPGF
jgi:aminoglycoside phosphotransferase (APT) family kinase protein